MAIIQNEIIINAPIEKIGKLSPKLTGWKSMTQQLRNQLP